MDPMTALISDLPGSGMPQQQPQQQQDMGGIMQQQPNMFAGMQAQPAVPQAPAPQQYAPVVPQMPPQWQQTTPQPPAPGQYPQAMPQAPVAPGMSAVPGAAVPGMPMMPPIPQFPSQQQQDMPEWAQQLVQSVERLQNGNDGGQGQAQAPSFNPDEPWSATNRPRSWDDMRKATEQLASKRAQEQVSQFMQQQQQQVEQARQAEIQAGQAIDQTFNRLRLNGVLPPIQNPNDPNDPGKQAERELLGYTLANGGQSPQDMLYAAPTLLQLHQMGQYYDVKSNQMIQRRGQSAAAMAPIAGGMPVMGAMGGSGGPTQSQLAMGARDLGSLMQMGMEAIQ